MRKIVVGIIFAMVIILFINQFLVQMVSNPSFKIEDIEQIGEDLYRVHYQLLSGSYSANLHVVAIPIANIFEGDLPIYIYYEGDYETYKSWTPYGMIAVGLLNELKMEVSRRNYKGNVELIDLNRLREIFTSDEKALIVIPTMAYWVIFPPIPIEENLMIEWIKNGGILIWIGPHPQQREMFIFPYMESVLEWDNLSYWRCSDYFHTGHTTLTVESNGLKSVKITHDDLSLAGKGFWGTFDPPGTWNFSIEDLYMSLWIKVDDMTNLSLIFIDITDINRNFRHYYLFPHRSTKIGDWVHFYIPISVPDHSSEKPIDLTMVDTISIVASVKNENAIGAVANICVKNISLAKAIEVVPTPLPLTNANEESAISDALNIKYGYVNLGPSIKAISLLGGKILGKVYHGLSDQEDRTSIGMIPVGSGRLILFGYGMFPPYIQHTTAWDIMQIIQSGILYTNGEIYYKIYNLKRNVSEKDFIDISTKNSKNFIFFTFSTDLHYAFFRKFYVNIKTG
jgi:hypothetical protein